MSILTARCLERLATHTPSETLAAMREELCRELARKQAVIKKRIESDEWRDVETAFEADATHAHKLGFE